jgi:hypothetical protein
VNQPERSSGWMNERLDGCMNPARSSRRMDGWMNPARSSITLFLGMLKFFKFFFFKYF